MQKIDILAMKCKFDFKSQIIMKESQKVKTIENNMVVTTDWSWGNTAHPQWLMGSMNMQDMDSDLSLVEAKVT